MNYTVVLVSGDRILFGEGQKDEVSGSGLFLKDVVFKSVEYKKIYIPEKSILLVAER
jgi:hypothetical protein